MPKNDLQESQQQGQGITIGTQGNEDQPTPLGDDLHGSTKGGHEDRHIANQDRSSASNLKRAEGNND